MVEKAKVSKLQLQPIKPFIDVQFWLEFTKLKLDVWKLETPQIEITAQLSMPMS
jgi:hypothetical protein